MSKIIEKDQIQDWSETEEFLRESKSKGSCLSPNTGKANLNTSSEFFLKKNVDYVENQYIGKYKLLKTLGKGSSAKVVKAQDTETGKLVAIKIIERTPKGLSDKRIYREIIICSLLNHPHIAKLYDFYYNEKYFFMIFEHIEGIQLYDMVSKKGALDEEEARKYFRQIVSAIDYIHRNSIVHRDLKIENILVDEFDNIKIIDFGLSNFFDSEELLGTFCGSLYFAAPELLLGNRYTGPEVDVWSLGVVLYVMLVGKVPFDDESIHHLQNKIKSCKFVFHKSISIEARELLTSMILASDARINLENVKKSDWVNLGYDNLVNNFMLVRKPLRSLNRNITNILSIVCMFQFGDVKKDLKRYLAICKNENSNLEQIHWSRKPIISLYYLMEERFEELQYVSKPFKVGEIEKMRISEENNSLVMHNFVKLLFEENNENVYNLFFSSREFKPELEYMAISDQGESSMVERKISQKYPEVKKSFIKGLFKGIKVKNSDEDETKKLLLRLFLENNIVYEANEKSYFCSYVYEGKECYFKVTMYFNVILNEHYILLNCLDKDSGIFKNVCEMLKKKINDKNK